MSLAVNEALEDGSSAEELQRKLRTYLNDPDMMYRRYRHREVLADGTKKWKMVWHKRVIGKDGKVHFVEQPLEKVGQGVYRSARKNALRTARTEINIAYRSADCEQWSKKPYVLGFRISLSNNHTTKIGQGNKKVPLHDMCDELQGDYPKTFNFSGWHPNCRCVLTPITATADQMAEYFNSGMPDGFFDKYTIKDMPANFEDWIANNSERIANATSQPYFIRDNFVNGDINAGYVWQNQSLTNEQPQADININQEENSAQNEENSVLKQAEIRHQQRTPEQVQAIKDKWKEHNEKIEQIKQDAQSALTIAKDYSEVDYSALEDAIATKNYKVIKEQTEILHKEFYAELGKKIEPAILWLQNNTDAELSKLINDYNSIDLTNVYNIKDLETITNKIKAKFNEILIIETKCKQYAAEQQIVPVISIGNTSTQTDHIPFQATFTDQLNMIKKMCNIRDKTTLHEYYDAVYGFTYQWDWEIRQIQCGNANFTSKHNHSLLNIIKRAEILEEFIDKSPKWNGGVTYRGISVSIDELNNIRVSLKAGTLSMLGAASFSTSKYVAEEFSGSHLNELDANGNQRTERVVFVTQTQRKATSIMYLSHYKNNEEEIVSSKDVRWKYVNEYTTGVSPIIYRYFEIAPSN